MLCLLAIFLLGVFSIPENNFFSNDTSVRIIGIGICLIVFSISQVLLPDKKITIHSVDIWWVILILLTGLSALWAFNGAYAIYGMFTAVLMYFTYSAFQNADIGAEENINYIFWIALSTIILILGSLLIGLIIFLINGQPINDTINRFDLIVFKHSDFLVSIALLLAPYITFTDKKLHKAFAPVMFVIFFLIIITIQPLKALLVLLFIAIIYVLANIKLSQINKYLLLGGTIGILVFGFVYGPVNKVALASQTKYTQESLYQQDRILLWKNSIKLFRESPLIGHGKHNWSLAVGKYGYDEYNIHLQTIHPKLHEHSFSGISQFMAELGILGLLAIIYIAILPCFRLVNERQTMSKVEVAGLVSVAIFFILGIIYGNPLNYFKSFQGAVLIGIIGIGIISQKSNRSTNLFQVKNKVIHLVILAGSIFVTVYFARIMHGEVLQKKAIKANLEKNYAKSQNLATKAIDIIPETESYQILYESLASQNKNKEALKLMKEATDKDPYNASLLYTFGEELLKNGNQKKAKVISDKIKKIAPSYLYNNSLQAKCVFIEKPRLKNYNNLKKLLKIFNQSSKPSHSSKEKYTPKHLRYDYVQKELSRFIAFNTSKIENLKQ